MALRSLGEVDVVLVREESDERVEELSNVLGGQRVAGLRGAIPEWSMASGLPG